MPPNFDYERQAGGPVAGVDEVGRGPWAGPVVAAAVVFDPDSFSGDQSPSHDLFSQIDDSKKLTAPLRRQLCHQIYEHADIGIGQASVTEIDQLNILGATLLAMVRAIADLSHQPDKALIDGNQAPDLAIPTQTIIRGDACCCSIAAASIVAKVTRDEMMSDLAQKNPGYGWERNAGYGTPEHRAALERYGITIHHRRGFRPIRDWIAQQKLKGRGDIL